MHRILFAMIATAPSMRAVAQTDPALAAMKAEWGATAAVIRKAAEQIPDADFVFAPVPTVRSLQLFGHIADAQFTLCGQALGRKTSPSGTIESTLTAKRPLLAKLVESMELCAKAYGQDLGSLTPAERRQRYDLMVHNTAHNAEHYGNIVTYMRTKGMVPPSSQR